ncbi:hypothetical protein GCM10009593_12470 [Microlunatus antarcticus]
MDARAGQVVEVAERGLLAALHPLQEDGVHRLLGGEDVKGHGAPIARRRVVPAPEPTLTLCRIRRRRAAGK